MYLLGETHFEKTSSLSKKMGCFSLVFAATSTICCTTESLYGFVDHIINLGILCAKSLESYDFVHNYIYIHVFNEKCICQHLYKVYYFSGKHLRNFDEKYMP